jgi:hypothetical protein
MFGIHVFPSKEHDVARVIMDASDIDAVANLLVQLGGEHEIPADIRGNASTLSKLVGLKMKRRDLRMVSLLLLQASRDQRVPVAQRHTARYWGAYLDQSL